MTQFLDLATFMKHVAVETFVAENDGLLGYAGMNNFYIYQFQDRPQFQVITWDKDNAFLQADFPAVHACRPKRADAAGADDSGRATGVPRWRDRRRRQRR